MARYLYSELASAIAARLNCIASGNEEWRERWTERISELKHILPSGSGIDSGTQIDLDRSHAEKLVLHTSFHHMNDGGYYDGWTRHTVTVTPSFMPSGLNLRISGPNRNGIKEYLYDLFADALLTEVGALKVEDAQ